MARYVHPTIKKLLESPTEGESIRVALVIKDGSETHVSQSVERLAGQVERTLPSGVLLVEIPHTNLSELCELRDVESISPDEQMEILG